MALTLLIVSVKSTPDNIATDLKTSMDTKTITNLYDVSFQTRGASTWAYYVYD